MKLQAILFDCDGVLAETERDGHRVAYNRAMTDLNIEVQWSEDEYAELVLISGGKERLWHYFSLNRARFPEHRFGREIIQRIYEKKTEIFKAMARDGALPPRAGIARVITEAHNLGISLFVCSTSHRESVESLLRRNYGEHCLAWFTELLCGDIVPHKKPAPDIYLLVKDKYHMDPECCCVIEDSRNGLLAAKGAGMRCLVTQSYYTTAENFTEADMVVSCLGDPNGEAIRVIKKGKARLKSPWITIADIEALL
jgi:HAD superfamily hydrolase (TIGR01509 family)